MTAPDAYWGDSPVHKVAEVEAEEVLLGRLPRDGVLPETQLILDAHDARLAADAREPDLEAEPEAGL
jgi:hypothetical protein